MNRKDENTKLTTQTESLEPGLREALGNFKASVNSWSNAMISRPREVKAPSRTNWSAVTKWALGCVVFVATLSGGVYQNHRQQEAAKAEAAMVAAQQQREIAATQLAKEDEENLMANVDSDVARQVPSALEPLASLMTEDDSKGN